MKKLLLLLAMAIMVIGLVAGCGKSADNGIRLLYGSRSARRGTGYC